MGGVGGRWRVAVECYGLTMARGGGWISFADERGQRAVFELAPNMTGFHAIELEAKCGTLRLVSKHVDRKRFNLYAKTDQEVDRFAKWIKDMPKGRLVAICITDTAIAAKRPPGPKLYAALADLGRLTHTHTHTESPESPTTQIEKTRYPTTL